MVSLAISDGEFQRRGKPHDEGHVFGAGSTATLLVSTEHVGSAGGSLPDEQGTDLMIIHEGIKVTIIDSLQNWYNITLPDGNEGWLKKDDIKKI